jgi:mannan endo-1,4-beta-mannosidase
MSTKPVTPSPSPEAAKLLDFIHGISGKNTLTGQHNAPMFGSLQLASVYKSLGVYPAVFGQDFGFSAPGDWDGINFRQQTVDEAIRRHQEGFIVTLMWHAVPPTEEEPVAFQSSIQSKITDQHWSELLKPGTKIHERWKSQVDVIAWHLKQLRHANVPVLWRPYHEMNGAWFWWGKKTGENGYKKLYRMLFERLVDFHGLNNLLWVYNCNEVREGIAPYAACYPGDDVVDILATDVYRGGFDQADYEQLLALANEKPIALGEVGAPPTPAILEKQPRWTWFMSWGDPSNAYRDGGALKDIYACERTITWEKLPWVKNPGPRIHYPILK